MQLDPIGVLFSKSWQRFQERFAVIVPIFLFPLVILGIGEALNFQRTVPAVLLGGILALLGCIVSVPAGTAMIAAIGENKNFSESYQKGFKLFWPSIWIALLVSLAYFGGLVLLIIPGIMLGIQLALVQYALVLEGKQGMAALAQSREYIKGYWWAFVGRAALLFLVLCGTLLILYLPFELVLGPIAAAIVYGLILIIFSPFSVCYLYEVFSNLQRLKPDASEVAAKTERAFLKVCMVMGILAIIGFIMLIFFSVAVILPAAIKSQNDSQNSYPSISGTSTIYDGYASTTSDNALE